MPAGNMQLAITITARGRVDQVVHQINEQLKPLGQSLRPMEKSLHESRQHLGQFGKHLRDIRQSAGDTARRFLEIVPPLAALGSALSVAGIGASVEQTAKWGKGLGNLADSLAITAPQLQVFQESAKLAGVSAEAMNGGLQSLQDSLNRAALGIGPSVAAFRFFHIATRNADGSVRNLRDVMPEVADAVMKAKDPWTQLYIATSLGGQAMAQLLPYLRQGREGIERYNEVVRKYGYELGPAGRAATDRLYESLTTLEIAVDGTVHALAVELSPTISGIVTHMADWLAVNRDWLGQKLDEGIKAVGNALAGADWAKIGEDVSSVARGFLALGQAIGPAIKGLKWLVAHPEIVAMGGGAIAGARLGGVPGAVVGGLTGAAVTYGEGSQWVPPAKLGPLVGPAIPNAEPAAPHPLTGLELLRAAHPHAYAAGGIVPLTGPAYLHAREMVLPPPIAAGFQSMFGRGGGDYGATEVSGAIIRMTNDIRTWLYGGLEPIVRISEQQLSVWGAGGGGETGGSYPGGRRMSGRFGAMGPRTGGSIAGLTPSTGPDETVIRNTIRQAGERVGLNPAQIRMAQAGFLSNFAYESGLRHAIVRPGGTDTGWAQWVGSRLTHMRQYGDPRSLDANQKQLFYELTGPKRNLFLRAANAASPREAALAGHYYESGGAPKFEGAVKAGHLAQADNFYRALAIAAPQATPLRQQYDAAITRYKQNVQGTGGYQTRGGTTQDAYGPPETFEQYQARMGGGDAPEVTPPPAQSLDSRHEVEVSFVNAPEGMRSGLRRGSGPAGFELRTQTAFGAF